MTPRRMKTRQRGVAVITALLLTTLAISIVASLFWQQQVQVRSMENQRLQLQTKWILRGALDWAGLVLRQDARDNPYTSLDQVWATPLAETRLDQYIERERVQGENFEATLSGNIVDASARYNLNNLATADGQLDPDQLAIFTRLLANLQIKPQLAKQAAQFVVASKSVAPAGGVPAGATGTPPGGSSPGGREGVGTDGGSSPGGGGPPGGGTGTAAVARTSSTMKLVQMEDLLAVPGFTPAMVEKLRPFVIVLPAGQTKINVNTAPPEVLAALVPTYSVMQANSLVEQRKRAPFQNIGMFAGQVNMANASDFADVKSDWFLVRSRIRLDRATLNAEALVSRTGTNQLFTNPEVKWIRQN